MPRILRSQPRTLPPAWDVVQHQANTEDELVQVNTVPLHSISNRHGSSFREILNRRMIYRNMNQPSTSLHPTLTKMAIEVITLEVSLPAFGSNDLKALVSIVTMNTSIAVVIETGSRNPPDKINYFALQFQLKLCQGTTIIIVAGTDSLTHIQELERIW